MIAPAMAKFLIAAIGALAITANAVARAHGWGNVDWVPIGTAWTAAVAVFAYPNVAVGVTTSPVPQPPKVP